MKIRKNAPAKIERIYDDFVLGNLKVAAKAVRELNKLELAKMIFEYKDKMEDRAHRFPTFVSLSLSEDL